jgi:hypothetical protein
VASSGTAFRALVGDIIVRARTMPEQARLGFLVWSTMLIAKTRRDYRANLAEQGHRLQ